MAMLRAEHTSCAGMLDAMAQPTTLRENKSSTAARYSQPLRVRDALTALGIGEDKLDLRKPAVTTADGSNAEARRVEVTLE